MKIYMQKLYLFVFLYYLFIRPKNVEKYTHINKFVVFAIKIILHIKFIFGFIYILIELINDFSWLDASGVLY